MARQASAKQECPVHTRVTPKNNRSWGGHEWGDHNWGEHKQARPPHTWSSSSSVNSGSSASGGRSASAKPAAGAHGQRTGCGSGSASRAGSSGSSSAAVWQQQESRREPHVRAADCTRTRRALQLLQLLQYRGLNLLNLLALVLVGPRLHTRRGGRAGGHGGCALSGHAACWPKQTAVGRLGMPRRWQPRWTRGQDTHSRRSEGSPGGGCSAGGTQG